METSLTPYAIVGLVASVIILAFCWLIYATKTDRPVKLFLSGLGIKLEIDTTGEKHRDAPHTRSPAKGN